MANLFKFVYEFNTIYLNLRAHVLFSLHQRRYNVLCIHWSLVSLSLTIWPISLWRWTIIITTNDHFPSLFCDISNEKNHHATREPLRNEICRVKEHLKRRMTRWWTCVRLWMETWRQLFPLESWSMWISVTATVFIWRKKYCHQLWCVVVCITRRSRTTHKHS